VSVSAHQLPIMPTPSSLLFEALQALWIRDFRVIVKLSVRIIKQDIESHIKRLCIITSRRIA